MTECHSATQTNPEMYYIQELLPIQAQLFFLYVESGPTLNTLLITETAPCAGPLHVNITEFLTSSLRLQGGFSARMV